MQLLEFQLEPLQFGGFPKMARLTRRAVVTEKIDGSNAQIYIVPKPILVSDISGVTAVTDTHLLYAGSRNRWITPRDDNFGFAAWVHQNAEELQQLGAGRHFGEWWGSGIQRGYGYKKGERFFSLFNAQRWVPAHMPLGHIPTLDPRAEPVLQQHAPACCRVVPVLYDGTFCTQVVEACMGALRAGGSIAEPGFMNPEGLVVYHVAAGVGFKKTLNGDDAKGGAA
jgi:hypothetical protein